MIIAQKDILFEIIKFKSNFLNLIISNLGGGVLDVFLALLFENAACIVCWLELDTSSNIKVNKYNKYINKITYQGLFPLLKL